MADPLQGCSAALPDVPFQAVLSVQPYSHADLQDLEVSYAVPPYPIDTSIHGVVRTGGSPKGWTTTELLGLY